MLHHHTDTWFEVMIEALGFKSVFLILKIIPTIIRKIVWNHFLHGSYILLLQSILVTGILS